MCSLPRLANVSTVQSVVSIARSAALSADSGDGVSRGAVLDVGGEEPGGEPAERDLRAAQVEQRSRVGRAGSPGRDLPHQPVADRGVEQLAHRLTLRVEHLERLVEVIGQQEPRDRADGAGRLDLVDRRLERFGPAGRVDEAEHPPRRAREPGPDPQDTGRALDLVADGDRRGRGARQVERAAEGVEQPDLGEAHGAGRDRQRRPIGAGGT